MLGFKSKKKKVNKYTEKNPFEAIPEELLGIGKGVASSVKDNFVDEGRQEVIEQLLSIEKKVDKHKLSGELTQGEEITLTGGGHAEEAKPVKSEAAPGLDYGRDYFRDIVHGREQAARYESAELSQRVQEITVELQRLVSQSAVLEEEFKEVTMTRMPKKAGTYHLNFFEWMLSVIRSARQKVEDSSSWLQAISSKKGQKQYWAMFKKHGTTFGMSNERSVATQTG